jgi:hypothetical protein
MPAASIRSSKNAGKKQVYGAQKRCYVLAYIAEKAQKCVKSDAVMGLEVNATAQDGSI